ncbi:type IV pilus assembly protein PilM [Rathayibacter soli]|uniref:type IV pilus assembly protein PilM n=1 Tax=Rathayibacter soli TaxID=3144168 RepID=UPI0027E4329F|nr:type IV pilus assembly protein PilM [Glaciibacter superstes]
MAKTVVGLDIGSTTLRAVEIAGADTAHPVIRRYRQAPTPAGSVTRGEVVEPNTVAHALKQLWAAGKFSTKRVVLGMGNQRVLARDLSVPKAPIERIRESLPFQVQDMLPMPVADALLDFYPISESQGETGPMVNGLLIAAVKEAVAGNVKAAQLAGLFTVEVDLIPFALDRALLTRQHTVGTVALIDIGYATTSVIIATNGVPQFVRIIPTGGGDVTDALATRLDMPIDEAELLKQRLGLAAAVTDVAGEHAAAIIYELTNELLGSLRNTVNYFRNTRPADPVSHIVLTGGGSYLRGLPEALREFCRLSVIPGDPFASVALARNVHPDTLRASKSSLLVALGLALGSAAA